MDKEEDGGGSRRRIVIRRQGERGTDNREVSLVGR
jgi:hypothetical protein